MNARLQVRTLHQATAALTEATKNLYAFKPTPVLADDPEEEKLRIGEEDKKRLAQLRNAMKECRGVVRQFVYRQKPFMNAKGQVMRP